MLKRNFEAASIQGDWTMPIAIDMSKYAPVWSDDVLVELHMTPDGDHSWDDYGLRQDTPYPRRRAGWHSFEANTQDGSSVVLVGADGFARVTVPAHVLRSLGPGMVSIGMHFVRQSTGQRVTLLSGRLPIASVP
jgi:predicted RNA binding protein YcfA (HicA-like mRNA interferase family)